MQPEIESCSVHSTSAQLYKILSSGLHAAFSSLNWFLLICFHKDIFLPLRVLSRRINLC